MNNKLIIFLLAFALMFYGCTGGQISQPPAQGGQVKQCPASCDNKEPCTIGYCNASTNFECVYNKTKNCYFDRAHGYSVLYPEDWRTGDGSPIAVFINTVDQSNDSAHCMIQSMNGQDILLFMLGINYTYNETTKQEFKKLFNHSLEELINQTKRFISNFGENHTIISENKRTVGGVEGYEIIYDYILNFYGGEDRTKPTTIIYVKSQTVVFNRDLTDYEISCSSRKHNFERYKPAFESIINRFKFVDTSNMSTNECDLKTGYEMHGDVMYSSKDLCLLELGKANKSEQICDEIDSSFMQADCITAVALNKSDPSICRNIRNNSNYGRPELDVWECIEKIAANTNNRTLCMQITDEFDDVRGSCLKEIANTEKDITKYDEEALSLAKSNLTAAIMKCQQFKEISNQKNCYTAVSDNFSGINVNNMFGGNTPRELINICLDDPNQYEWLACLYGRVFDSLTGTDHLWPSFKEKIKSDTYKTTTFCELFEVEYSYYTTAVNLHDEICEK